MTSFLVSLEAELFSFVKVKLTGLSCFIYIWSFDYQKEGS